MISTQNTYIRSKLDVIAKTNSTCSLQITTGTRYRRVYTDIDLSYIGYCACGMYRVVPPPICNYLII